MNGLFATATTSEAARIPRDTAAIRIHARAAVDTSWTFAVDDRTWHWSSFAASVGLGSLGGSGVRRPTGMTTAPDTAASSAWSVCAAASVGMRNATLTLRGARGAVHLRADASALTRVNPAMRDTTSRPRR